MIATVMLTEIFRYVSVFACCSVRIIMCYMTFIYALQGSAVHESTRNDIYGEPYGPTDVVKSLHFPGLYISNACPS